MSDLAKRLLFCAVASIVGSTIMLIEKCNENLERRDCIHEHGNWVKDHCEVQP